jgi:hypothetical protein
VQHVGGLNILAILAPARITGVYDAITASAKFGESRRLAGSRHPVTKTLDIGTTLPSVKRRRGRVGETSQVYA